MVNNPTPPDDKDALSVTESTEADDAFITKIEALTSAVGLKYSGFAPILYLLRFFVEPELPTFAGTDASLRVALNRELCEQLDDVELTGIILHEMYHVLLNHRARYPYAINDPTIWNYATDLEINESIKQYFNKELQQMILLPEKYGFEPFKTAEEYLALLRKLPQPPQGGSAQDNSQSQGQGGSSQDNSQSQTQKHRPPQSNNGSGQVTHGNCGSIVHDMNPSNATTNSQGKPLPDIQGRTIETINRARKEVIEQLAREAATQQKTIGNMPAALQQLIEDHSITDTYIDWKDIFQQLLDSAIANRTTGIDTESYEEFEVTNILYANTPDAPIYPGKNTKKLRVTAVIDTSGSMSESDLRTCLSEIKNIASYRNCTIDVLSCDTETHIIENWETDPLIGGGGTDMVQGIIDAHETSQRPPNIIVVITDGYTPWPSEPISDVPIIAVIVGEDIKSVLDNIPPFILGMPVNPSLAFPATTSPEQISI